MIPVKGAFADIPLFRLSPPYDTVHWCHVSDERALDALSPGGLLMLRPLPLHEWEEVREAVEYLERRCIRASIVLWTDVTSRDRAFVFASRGRAIGICCVMPGPLLDVDSLRAQLTDASDFPDQMVRWLRVAGLPLDATTSAALRTMLAHPRQRSTLKGVLRDFGLRRDAWRSSFEARGLGRPGRWFHICSFFGHVFLALQADANMAVAPMADRLGFFDDAALRRRCRAIVGVPPAVIRECLGWRWALHAALVRAGLTRRRASSG